MTDSPNSRRSPGCLVATSIVLILLAVYVGGYFWLGEYDVQRSGSVTYHNRSFSNSDFVTTYLPLGWIECRVRNEPIWLLAPNDTDPFMSEATEFRPF